MRCCREWPDGRPASCGRSRGLRGRGALEEGALVRPDRPRRWTLPITALRVMPPSSAAIWEAERPSDQSFLQLFDPFVGPAHQSFSSSWPRRWRPQNPIPVARTACSLSDADAVTRRWYLVRLSAGHEMSYLVMAQTLHRCAGLGRKSPKNPCVPTLAVESATRFPRLNCHALRHRVTASRWLTPQRRVRS